MLKGVTLEKINITIVNNNEILEKFEKIISLLKNSVDGTVLNVINTEVRKLSSKLKFSKVSKNENKIKIMI
jgi:hypothetical protein